ncbi:MAG TPA: hypothetical protein GXX38_09345 [Clostridia bacterium]|jgi:hut operon positive regulator|nr:hypothetical protein [Clostridia bacterium]
MNALESRICSTANGSYTLVGRAAIMLALSYTREGEKFLKTELKKNDFACATTCFGSRIDKVKRKITEAVLGTAIKNGVIEKTAEEIRALIKAIKKARSGFCFYPLANTGYVFKAGLVSDGKWIAVALFGQSVFFPENDKEQVGLGIMRIKQW